MGRETGAAQITVGEEKTRADPDGRVSEFAWMDMSAASEMPNE
jgi:predicted lactoylglutathione lyase